MAKIGLNRSNKWGVGDFDIAGSVPHALTPERVNA